MFIRNVLQYLPLLELIQPGCSLGSHRLGQVSEGLVTGQVQLLRVVVGEDPGEHRVLHQVIVRPGEKLHDKDILVQEELQKQIKNFILLS